MRLGFVALGRTTFDVGLAADDARRAHAALSDHEVVGSTELLTDTPEAMDPADLDAVVVVMATFADSTLPAAAVAGVDIPILLWGIPEPRTGGRLRLNSLCGINLAGYELRRRGQDVRWVHVDPASADAGAAVEAALAGTHRPPQGEPVGPDLALGARLADALAAFRVGVVGEPPAGFTPCRADEGLLAALGAPRVDTITVESLFERAAGTSPDEARHLVAALDGVGDRDPHGVDQDLRLHLGLRSLAEEHRWDGVATRCWPECFTEFGAAACAAQGMLADAGTPATCEADLPGTLTALVLRAATGEDPFVADLVDVADDGTMAFWHCGLAPESLAGEPPTAVDHPNRGLPLLRQFRLRPGRVTIARLSASLGRPRLVVGGGEVLDRPRPYHGTSGVVRMDRDGREVLATVMAEGLDHHYGIVPGDVRAGLAGLAAHLGLEVVWL